MLGPLSRGQVEQEVQVGRWYPLCSGRAWPNEEKLLTTPLSDTGAGSVGEG
jgi:hypothetical protein